MKKTYISPMAELLCLAEESMLAASVTSVGGQATDDGLNSEIGMGQDNDAADVKGNTISGDLFD